MWPISSSRASRRRIPAYRPSGVRRDDRATKDGSAAYLLGRICSAASTPSPFAFLCELTRRPFGGEARGLRHRVISPSASVDAVLHLPERPGSSGGRSVRSCGRRRTAAASKSHLVEVACELAALDPARGSKPGSNSRTRRAPRWRPRPTPEGTRFLFLAQARISEQTPTRTDLRSRLLHVPN